MRRKRAFSPHVRITVRQIIVQFVPKYTRLNSDEGTQNECWIYGTFIVCTSQAEGRNRRKPVTFKLRSRVYYRPTRTPDCT